MARSVLPRKTLARSAAPPGAAEPAGGEARSVRGEESWYLSPNNRAGSLITPDTGATVASAYACIIRLASDIGAMPFNVKRRAKDGSTRTDWDAPGQDLISNGPNAKMTSQSWIEAGMWHCLTHGNAYSRGRYDGTMEFESFDLLDPALVQPAETKSGELYYRVAGESVPAAEILHVRAPGYNGINGKSPIRQCAESMGLTMAVEAFGADFFAHGIRPSGIISFDEDPDEESVEEIRKTVAAEHAGRHSRIMTLTGNAKWNPTAIKPEEAQFLLTRGYQLRECCRIFSVPGPKVGDFSETSFSSLEELNLDYYQSSLIPWLTRFEKEWLRKLFPLARQRKLYAIEHDRNHLLKGRMIDQANVFKILKEIGVMNGNQIAAHYGLPSHDGGQYYTIQLNQGSDKAIGEATLEQLKGVKVEPAKSSEPDTSTRSTKILPTLATVDAERRFLGTAEVRARTDEAGNPTTTFVGYALKYNTFSEDLGGFKEVIKPGAFTESLKTADIRALLDHNPEKILGRNTAGTLRLEDDAIGLRFEVDADPRITYVANVTISIGRKDKDQCSFGFFCDECEWDWFPGSEDLVLRSITLGRIFDVSIVTFPAYTDTEVALRSLDAANRPDLRSVVRRSIPALPPAPKPAVPAPAGMSRMAQRRYQLDMLQYGRRRR